MTSKGQDVHGTHQVGKKSGSRIHQRLRRRQNWQRREVLFNYSKMVLLISRKGTLTFGLLSSHVSNYDEEPLLVKASAENACSSEHFGSESGSTSHGT